MIGIHIAIFLIIPYLAPGNYFMNRTIVERNLVALLFVAVLITFSFAERDSKKLDKLYTKVIKAGTEKITAKQAAIQAKAVL